MPQLNLLPDQFHVNFLRTNIDQISGNPRTLLKLNQNDYVWGFTFPPLGRNKGLRKGFNLALPAQLNDFQIGARDFLYNRIMVILLRFLDVVEDVIMMRMQKVTAKLQFEADSTDSKSV